MSNVQKKISKKTASVSNAIHPELVLEPRDVGIHFQVQFQRPHMLKY